MLSFKAPSAPAGWDAPIVVIGDVHGHSSALSDLLMRVDDVSPGSRLVFVGDLGHKGPDSVGVYRTVLDLVDSGRATVVASNHGVADAKHLGRELRRGRDVIDAALSLHQRAASLPPHATLRHVAALAGDLAGARDGDELAARIVRSQREAPLQLRVDEGRAVVVHGGLTPETFGVSGTEARSVCLYGTGCGRDASGVPIGRDSWVETWQQARRADPGLPFVFYGHVRYDRVRLTFDTCGLDTGCGSPVADATLSAALWRGVGVPVEVVSVPAPPEARAGRPVAGQELHAQA